MTLGKAAARVDRRRAPAAAAAAIRQQAQRVDRSRLGLLIARDQATCAGLARLLDVATARLAARRRELDILGRRPRCR
jgi:hypothetical protein